MICYDNISFRYANAVDKTIKDFSLFVPKGKCILLTGKSGCGKTTIIRFINGLIPNFYAGESKGDVFLENKNIKDMCMSKISQKVGSVFQNPKTQFFNTDTTSEIAFGVENLSIEPSLIRSIVNNTYENLRIEKLRDRNIFELSGGEKQKIAFASIYAMNPDVYVLDEPSSNLDCQSIDDIKNIIKILKDKNKTIIISEHRIYYLIDLVDEVLYMDSGRITKRFNREEFKQISEEERCAMGIRAINLHNIYPKKNEFSVSSQSILSVRHVQAGYKKSIVLKDISFEAKRGECIAILGKNGSGKSTLSRVLCGLHRECSGEILFKNKRVKDKERLNLSYLVMQDVNYQLFAETVESESSFGLQNIPKEEVEEVLDSLGLLYLKEQHPNTLSGGQKQRLVIATSILSNKSIYVFDEPTSGQDYESMIQVSKVINYLRNQGKLIFVVTHDYEFLCNTCTRTIFIEDGEVATDVKLSTSNGISKIREFFVGRC